MLNTKDWMQLKDLESNNKQNPSFIIFRQLLFKDVRRNLGAANSSVRWQNWWVFYNCSEGRQQRCLKHLAGDGGTQTTLQIAPFVFMKKPTKNKTLSPVGFERPSNWFYSKLCVAASITFNTIKQKPWSESHWGEITSITSEGRCPCFLAEGSVPTRGPSHQAALWKRCQVIVMPDPLPSLLARLWRCRIEGAEIIKWNCSQHGKNKDYKKQFLTRTSTRRRGGVCKIF